MVNIHKHTRIIEQARKKIFTVDSVFVSVIRYEAVVDTSNSFFPSSLYISFLLSWIGFFTL